MMSSVLDYRTPIAPAEPRSTALLWIALVCGGGALAVGVLIFLLWLLTRAEALELIGLIWILLGMALFIIGSGCLLVDTILRLKSATESRRKVSRRAAAIAVLLLVNYPAAFCIIWTVLRIDHRAM